jgi:hypothetical protein
MNKIKTVIKTDKDYIIIEADGTERHICNLHFGQMIGFYKGYHYYKKEVPENYFEKATFLESKGWYPWYHYDYWVHEEKTKNVEYGGLNTESALKQEEAER